MKSGILSAWRERWRRWQHRGAGTGAAGRARALADVLPTTDEIEQAWQLGAGLPGLVNETVTTATWLSGDQLARRLGQGLDFEQLRAYQPGEPAHAIDWRISARTDRPMVRLYREPAQRQCHLILDTGPSMFFGTRQRLKLTQSLLLAHLISAAALRQGMACVVHDPAQPTAVSGMLGGNGPTTSRSALLDRLASLPAAHLDPQLSGASVPDWTGFRARLLARLPAGQLVVVLSDFLGGDEPLAWLPLARAHHLKLIQLLDPAEQQLPDLGMVAFAGDPPRQLDTGARSGAGRSLRRELTTELNAQQQALRDLALGTAGWYDRYSTRDSLPELATGLAGPGLLAGTAA